MKLNALPEDHEGENLRRTEFGSLQEKLEYDADGIIAITKNAIGKIKVDFHYKLLVAYGFANRSEDTPGALEELYGDPHVLRKAIAAKLKVQREKEASTNGKIDGVKVGILSKQFEKSLASLKVRFDVFSNAFPESHDGVEWVDVENALKADPDSMGKIMAFDAKGHNMIFFGEENGEFVFVSGWDECEEISQDHRNITYDLEGQKIAEKQGQNPNGNAVSIIAKIMGIAEEEAANYLVDQKLYEQLSAALKIQGLAWLKTDVDNRKTGNAFNGGNNTIGKIYAAFCSDLGSFRAKIKVKKVD